MRKPVVFGVIMLLSVFMIIPAVYAQQPRIYNDGSIDYAPNTASFVLSAEDNESNLKEIQYSVDGSDFKVYTEPIKFLTEGRHIIVYRAIDKAGNISSEKIYSVIIDATPPDGIVSVEGPYYVSDGNIYISSKSRIILWAEDKLSGVEGIYVSLDGSDYIPYTEPVSIDSEGEHTATAYAVDNVGNRTDVYSLKGYVDNSGPSVSIKESEPLVEVNGQYYTNKNNEFSIEATDNLSGVKKVYVSLDGSPFVEYTSPFKIQYAGEHLLKAKAVDNLGNESVVEELKFFVDVTPPKPSIGGKVD